MTVLKDLIRAFEKSGFSRTELAMGFGVGIGIMVGAAIGAFIYNGAIEITLGMIIGAAVGYLLNLYFNPEEHN